MAKVMFRRIADSSLIDNYDIEDGTFWVTEDGAFYIDFGTNRVGINVTGDALLDRIYPVGTYYETSDTTFDPNVSFVGTWVLDNDGTVLVSKSETTNSVFNTSVGTTVGSETHTLTVAEIPPLKLYPNEGANTSIIGGYTTSTTGSTKYLLKTQLTDATTPEITAGGGETKVASAHNIVQPSKIVYRWHRTA